MKEDTALQMRLRQDDKKALEEVYLENRSYVIKYFRDFQSVKPQLEDIYQDSIIDLYQNFVTRQLRLEEGNIRSYLMTIVKRKIYKTLKNQKQAHNLALENPPEDSYQLLEIDSDSEAQKQLAIHYKKLGKKCQELLKLFYYRGLSIKEIKEAASYKDENTVKSSKSRCLKQLKNLINQS